MRRGIPDTIVRGRTMTLYIDKAPFWKVLGIRSERMIYSVLVEQKGRVYRHAVGPPTQNTVDFLRGVLKRYVYAFKQAQCVSGR